MKNYKKLKKAFADDPDMIRSLEMEEQSATLADQKDVMREFFKGQALSEAQKAKLDFIQSFLRGTDGDTPTDEKLIELIVPLIEERIPAPIQGEQGEDGKDYVLTENDKKQIARAIRVPTVEKVIERVEVIKEQPIITEKLIEKDIDEDKFMDAFIKRLKEKKEIDISHIRNAEQFKFNGKKYNLYELMHGGGGSSTSSITYSVDLSAQANGSNKVFTVPTNSAFILLTGTDAPFIYRPIVDYTGTGTTTLTLDAGVNAPSSGATFILTYKS